MEKIDHWLAQQLSLICLIRSKHPVWTWPTIPRCCQCKWQPLRVVGTQARLFFFCLLDCFYFHLWKILFLSSRDQLLMHPAGSCPSIPWDEVRLYGRYPGTAVLPVAQPALCDTMAFAWAIFSVICIFILDMSPQLQIFISYCLPDLWNVPQGPHVQRSAPPTGLFSSWSPHPPWSRGKISGSPSVPFSLSTTKWT